MSVVRTYDASKLAGENVENYLTLGALALLDSMSLGTLVIPLALVVRSRRVEPVALTVYLATVSLVYFAIGIALVAGIDLLSSTFTALQRTTAFHWLTLVLGLGLAGVGILWPTPPKPEPGRDVFADRPRPSSLGAMIVLGLGASLTEVVTMVPYLAATGIMSTMPVGWGGKLVLLAAYCLVMVLPAIVLLSLAALLGHRIFPWLSRLAPRLEYETKITLLWIAALVGLQMIWRGIGALQLLGT
ncbi:GAP family protein [Buchananella hordeovulneris]|uniref:GAP family protein n=1 Tax=Buchananella hordeovulneris TaxID=52770 RepID=UPI0026DA9F31|nr:GAP family protein [Buchananella hordeovulneris]MDO5081269.1 GAP family protein [Buchananella hordeovulneris]